MFHNPNYVSIPPRDDRRTATASPLFRGVRRSRGVCIRKHIPKVLISGIHIRAGSASGIHTPPLPWHPFQKGTLPPCHLYPHSPPNSCHPYFSMFHNHLAKQVNIRVFRCSILLGVMQLFSPCLAAAVPYRQGTSSPLSLYPHSLGSTTNLCCDNPACVFTCIT